MTEEGVQPPTKKQKQKEKQVKISQFTTETPQHAPAIESAAGQSNLPPHNSELVTIPGSQAQTDHTTSPPARYYPHQLEFGYCPEVNCAADHPFLCSSESLVWTLLVLKDPVHNGDKDKLMGGTLICAICITENISPPQEWTWICEKWGSSTSNFLQHFTKAHTDIWKQLHEKDQSILKPNVQKQTETQGLHSWSKVSGHKDLLLIDSLTTYLDI
jgi:hypothetical protein